MFTRSKRLQDLQELADKAQSLVREQLVEDFVMHLEDEYGYAMVGIDEVDRPSILIWLGRVGGYYAMVQDRLNAVDQLDAVRSAILGVFDWEEFATKLDVALNEKYSERMPARLTIEPVEWDDKNPFNPEKLSFRYYAHCGWDE